MLHNHVTWSLPGLQRLALALVLVGVMGLLGLQAPAPAAQAQSLSVDSLVRADGTLDLTRGASGTVDLKGWRVNLDPKRGPVLARENAAPSALDAWSALPGNGLNSTVDALAVVGNTLYVGGNFFQTFDGTTNTHLNNIAKFDGTNWSALPGNGLNNTVWALAVMGNTLYVGGSYTQTFDGTTNTNLKSIAKFDGTNWSALPGNGLSDAVYAMAVVGNSVYMGGIFTQTFDGTTNTNLKSIAKFDGTNWVALPGNGLNNTVWALAVMGNTLYVGGSFTQTFDGTTNTNLKYIAKFDGTNWSALPGNGLSDAVYAMAVGGNTLYVGGRFTQTFDGTTNTNLKHIAKFDGTNWVALPGNGLNSFVYTIAVSGNMLYVGGYFTQTSTGSVTNLNYIAKFDGTNWAALPGNGLNNYVDALMVLGNRLYVGGSFTQTSDGSVTNLNKIATLTLAPTQTGPTYSVNKSTDTDDGLCDTSGTGNGNKDCTLREAIHAANAQGGANTIEFEVGLSIELSSPLPTVTGDTTIDGETNAVSISGAGAYRILTVESAVTLNVNHLTLQNGKAEPSLTFGQAGGAIYDVGGTLNVSNSTFVSNSAGNYGGAIYTNGPTTISNSTFYQNNATDVGGGVTVNNGTILNSTFSENASGSGGAVYAGGTLTLKNSILANSTGGGDCAGNAGSSSIHNLIDDGNSACGMLNGTDGNIIGSIARLQALNYRGGGTQTLGLEATSPALNAGEGTTCADAPVSSLDQRGISRSFSGQCDMGSFEKTTADCLGSEMPAKPTLLEPANHKTMSKAKVAFDWTDAVCATSYTLTVKNLTAHTKTKKTVTDSKAKVALGHGSFKWFVQACNGSQCIKSRTFKFTN